MFSIFLLRLSKAFIFNGIENKIIKHGYIIDNLFKVIEGPPNKDTIEIVDQDQDQFSEFMQWIENYNVYIFNAWKDKAGNTEDAISKEDEKVVDDFVKVTDEEFNGQF